MVLIIIGLLFGGYLLFSNADKIRERLAGLMPKRKVAEPQVFDADALSGRGFGDNQSKYG